MQKRIYAIKENALKQYKIIPEHAKKHKLTFIFFHPDYTVGFGITPNHAFRLVGYTTGRELHPALKIVIQLQTIIISDIISVNKKFFSRLSKYNNFKQVNTGYFLISFCLGNSIPPAAQTAIRFGGILSGGALIFAAVLIAVFAVIRLTSRPGQENSLSARLLTRIKNRSSIARLAALRRFCSVMAMTLHCGMDMAEGCRMAASLVDNASVLPGVKACEKELASGKAFYDSIEPSGLFSGFDLQMIRIGSRAGQLETVMKELEADYDERSSDALDSLIARLEPAIVSVLAVAVGLVLLSVMLPLAGILSSIG